MGLTAAEGLERREWLEEAALLVLFMWLPLPLNPDGPRDRERSGISCPLLLGEFEMGVGSGGGVAWGPEKRVRSGIFWSERRAPERNNQPSEKWRDSWTGRGERLRERKSPA